MIILWSYLFVTTINMDSIILLGKNNDRVKNDKKENRPMHMQQTGYTSVLKVYIDIKWRISNHTLWIESTDRVRLAYVWQKY